MAHKPDLCILDPAARTALRIAKPRSRPIRLSAIQKKTTQDNLYSAESALTDISINTKQLQPAESVLAMTAFPRLFASVVFTLMAGVAGAANMVALDDPSTVVTVMQFTLKPGASRDDLL